MPIDRDSQLEYLRTIRKGWKLNGHRVTVTSKYDTEKAAGWSQNRAFDAGMENPCLIDGPHRKGIFTKKYEWVWEDSIPDDAASDD